MRVPRKDGGVRVWSIGIRCEGDDLGEAVCVLLHGTDRALGLSGRRVEQLMQAAVFGQRQQECIQRSVCHSKQANANN